jgi:GT2 family glycosyltransferase
MQLSIIIVNWNAGSQLAEVVSSIKKYHHGLVSSVVIVDNASTDDSLDRVETMQDLPFKPQIIRNSENCGFGKACNLGAQQAKGEYLLFLNPDAALYADTLPKALAFMQDPANSKVGICGVQLLDEAGHVSRSCARFPSAVGFVAHAVGLDRFFPRLGHFMAEWDHAQTRQVDHVIGAFFLVRRELFNAMHGFDERFFVYLEDLDFSYRACQAGWRSVYLADAQAFHAGGGTSNQVKARRLFYSLRSRLLYAFKHFSSIGAVGVLLTTLLVEPVSRSALALLRCSWAGLKETWAAYGMLWRWLPQWVFKGVTR